MIFIAVKTNVGNSVVAETAEQITEALQIVDHHGTLDGSHHIS